MTVRTACGAAWAVILLGGTAAAAPLAPGKEPEPASAGPGADPAVPPAGSAVAGPALPAEPTVSYSHQGQFQASLRLALGLRALVPYDKADYCGATDSSTTTGNAPVCTGRAPFSMDLEIGYGVAKRIDVIAELRIGLETDFSPYPVSAASGPRMFHVAPGARFFFSDAKTSKLFTTAQIVFDLAGYEDAGGASRGTDLGVRNLNGLWLDLDRTYGVYAYVGETATFGRWLRFELEAGIGISGRYR